MDELRGKLLERARQLLWERVKECYPTFWPCERAHGSNQCCAYQICKWIHDSGELSFRQELKGGE